MMMQYEPETGVEIEKVFFQTILMAKRLNKTVVITVNDIVMCVDMKSKLVDLVAQYRESVVWKNKLIQEAKVSQR